MNYLSNKNVNFIAFLWHAVFLAFAATFTNINTILPSMVIKSGGNNFQVGLLTAIMVGTPIIGQILFASYLHLKGRKKPFLLLGINLRVLALALVSLILWQTGRYSESSTIIFIFALMFVFSISGTFADVSYLDILGKSLLVEERQAFFVWRQILKSAAILIAALVARRILSVLEYPVNYQWLFLLAAMVLFIASFGFWAIKEKKIQQKHENYNFIRVLKTIPHRFSNDRNLRNYIFMINFSGFGLTLLPFYVVLAKQSYGLTGKQIGAYLLLQIIGMIISNFVWARLVKRHGFRGVFKGCIIIGTMLPLLAITLANFPIYFYLTVFFVSGFGISAREVSAEGIFIEISKDENRALYRGITGAMSLSTAAFPLVAGWLIGEVGFVPVFVLSSLMVAVSYYFVHGLRDVCPV